MRDLEQETRERLLAAAARLFAERGFANVTVRDICKAARANVAAVNYHFDGKRGLYREVVQAAIERMQGTTEAIRKAGHHRPPEEQLASYIAIFLRRVVEARDSWIHQLLVHELADPTPALDLIVTQVMKPRMAYVADIIAAVLGCARDDRRVAHCVMSVQSQCLWVLNNRLPARFNPPLTPRRIAALADHIARFSLGGIRALTR